MSLYKSYSAMMNSYNFTRDKKSEHEGLYFYHISHAPLHDEGENGTILYPLEMPNGENRIVDVKRICVAPTIEQCITAIAWNVVDYIYVYRTKIKSTKSYVPYDVVDAPITQERWIRNKRQFVLSAMIPCNRNSIICSGNNKNYVMYNPGARGEESCFEEQMTELYKHRSFVKKYSKNWFVNDLEYQIHKNQSQKRLNLNRSELPLIAN